MNVHTEQQPEVIAGAGHRLRIAREKAGLSVAEVAERLHMPLRVVHSLESDDWSCLGAPVFVRGQLRSYARLLGLVTEPVLQASGVAPVAPVTLTPRTYTPKMRLWAEHAARRSVYAVLTLVIALPVWLAMQPQFRKDSSEVAPLDGAQSHPQPASGSAAQSQAPLIASMTPIATPRPSAATSAAAGQELLLRLTADSWVQIADADGRIVESALLKAGEERRLPLASNHRVVLGNASAVHVLRNGQVQDLAQFQRANVARFTVSSGGSLAPVAD